MVTAAVNSDIQSTEVVDFVLFGLPRPPASA